MQLLIPILLWPLCMLLHCSSHIACLRFGAAGSSAPCQGWWLYATVGGCRHAWLAAMASGGIS